MKIKNVVSELKVMIKMSKITINSNVKTNRK